MGLRLTFLPSDMNSALSRNAFKPNNSFKEDPVPAGRADSLPNQPRFVPASGRDPIPAALPDEINIPKWSPNPGFSVDPIPARSA